MVFWTCVHQGIAASQICPALASTWKPEDTVWPYCWCVSDWVTEQSSGIKSLLTTLTSKCECFTTEILSELNTHTLLVFCELEFCFRWINAFLACEKRISCSCSIFLHHAWLFLFLLVIVVWKQVLVQTTSNIRRTFVQDEYPIGIHLLPFIWEWCFLEFIYSSRSSMHHGWQFFVDYNLDPACM